MTDFSTFMSTFWPQILLALVTLAIVVQVARGGGTGILRWLALVPMALAVAALFAMMVMTFSDVMLRSILNMPIEAATELTRILMAVVVFSALPIVSATNGHIAVDLLDGFFGPVASRWRDAVIALLCGAMLWWPAGRVVDLANRAASYGDVTEYLAIPQYWIAMFIALFTYFTVAALIARGLLLIVAPGRLEPRDG